MTEGCLGKSQGCSEAVWSSADPNADEMVKRTIGLGREKAEVSAIITRALGKSQASSKAIWNSAVEKAVEIKNKKGEFTNGINSVQPVAKLGDKFVMSVWAAD